MFLYIISHKKMANIFELSTLDVLGSSFRLYISEIRALSLTNSKNYFILRNELSKKIVDDTVSQMYKSIFKALTKGTTHNDNALSNGAVAYGGAGAAALVPGYPSQKANIIAMRISEMLESELLSVLDILMPVSFDNIMSASMNKVSRSSALHMGTPPAGV